MPINKEWPYGYCRTEEGWDDDGYWFCGTELINNDYCPKCDIHWNKPEEETEPCRPACLFDFDNNMIYRRIDTMGLITEGSGDCSINLLYGTSWRPLEIWCD